MSTSAFSFAESSISYRLRHIHRPFFGSFVTSTRVSTSHFSARTPPRRAISPRCCLARKAVLESQPVLVPSRTTETWEDCLSSPAVLRYVTDDGARLAMWYSIRLRNQEDDTDRTRDMIALAVSDDGLVWRKVTGPLQNGAVLAENVDQWWAFDTTHVSVGSILFTAPQRVRADAGIYLLYYTGRGNESIHSRATSDLDGITRIGVAISKDGEHFTRMEGSFPSGAILDTSLDESDVFDNATVGSPCVVYDDSAKLYVMYYHGAPLSRTTFAIGRVISKDSFLFERDVKNDPVVTRDLAPERVAWADKGVCRPSVVLLNAKVWGMFVEVIGADDKHRIALTESVDGVNWGPLSLVLDVGQNGQWDAGGVSHPCAVLLDDGAVWLYYTGKSDNQEFDGRSSCIGVARSDERNWHILTRL